MCPGFLVRTGMTDVSIPDQGGRDLNLTWVLMPLVMCDLEDLYLRTKRIFFFPQQES